MARDRTARHWREDQAAFTRGKFSTREGSILRAGIERLVAQHAGKYDSVEDFVAKAQKGEWAEICTLLPARSRKACYEYCRRHFHAGNYRGAWGEFELERLKVLHATHGPKWTLIGEELGRERTNVRDKWRELQVRDRVSGSWTDEEDVRLLTLIEEACGSDPALLSARAPLPWASIALKLGGREPKQCRTAWKRLAVRTDDGVRQRGGEIPAAEMVATLYHSGVLDPSEVTWNSFGCNAHRRFDLLYKGLAAELGAGGAITFRGKVAALHRQLNHVEAAVGSAP